MKASGLWKRRYKKYVESVPFSGKNMKKGVEKWEEEWLGKKDPRLSDSDRHNTLGTAKTREVPVMVLMLKLTL